MSVISEEWRTEIFEESTAFSVRVINRLHDAQSPFQRVEVYDTASMGKVLLLGGCFMVTQRDSFVYHEMLVHPGANAIKKRDSALVIGGGDGGAITELAKYQDFKSLTLCEIDREVIEVSREHFPAISAGLDDPRVVLRTGDAAVFIEGSIEKWDLILVDSTDPVGPGKALFEKKFFRNIKERLNEGGVAIFQTESPLFMEEVFTRAVKNLKEVFGESNATPYLATVPSYPGGLWSFTFCSNGISPIGNDFGPVPSEIGKELGYYDPDVARCAFALPPFIRRMLGESSHGGPR